MRPCCHPIPPSGDACGKPATYMITFKDGDSVATCHGCALELEQLAETSGPSGKSGFRIDKIEPA
jgi:hypothetical protein